MPTICRTMAVAPALLSTVLSGYANMQMGPVYTTEVIEKRVFGSAWKDNYKKKKKSMPVSLYKISKDTQRL